MVCKKAAEELGKDGFAKKPVGAGPYKIVKNEQGKEVVFVKTAKGFQAKTVVTGKRGGGRIEIVDGLAAGAVVVVVGVG